MSETDDLPDAVARCADALDCAHDPDAMAALSRLYDAGRRDPWRITTPEGAALFEEVCAITEEERARLDVGDFFERTRPAPPGRPPWRGLLVALASALMGAACAWVVSR